MTPFQAIKATFYMLLAKAREPIQERELAPAPAGAGRQRWKAIVAWVAQANAGVTR